MENVQASEKIEILKALQHVDRLLSNIARMKEHEPRRLREAEGGLAGQEARLKDLDARHQQAQREIGRKELDVKSRQEKIDRHKAQLLKASTNKEYQALLNEISLEEMEKRRVEEAILEMMIGVEEFASEERKIEAGMEDVRRHVEAVRAEVAKSLEEVRGEEKELLARRREIAAKLDADTLRRYEGLFKSRAGEAMVPATYEPGTGGEEGRYLCRGCFMPLTHQMVNLLLLAQELVTCKSCGRLLYIDDTQPRE